MKKIVLGMLIFCGFINFAEAAIEHCIYGVPTMCFMCEDGYTPNKNKDACIECNIPNCVGCSDDGQSCAYCGTNYGKDGNGGCKPCPEHCRSCDDAQVCRYCENGYILQKNGTCSIGNCSDVLYGNCKQCATGYALKNGECVPTSKCEGGTVYITRYSAWMCNPTNCLNGTGRLYVKDSSPYAYRCESCPDGSVFLNGNCVGNCPDGYIERYDYTLGGNNCVPENCSRNDTVCTECATGYYLTEDYKCVTECPEGFLNSPTGKCAPEDSGCGNMIRIGNECVLEGDSDAECGAGFEKVNGVCVGKLRYTLPEADELTSDDNENMIEWIFE